MTVITSDELKEIQLNILKDIHQFCKEKKLTYFLCGGTLIGAVRHGGFIPWDDDIDIYMPRPDYDEFLALYQSDDKKYRLLSFPKSKGYYLPFAKVCDTRTVVEETIVRSIPNCGVFVDVFPLDGLSDSVSIAKRIHIKNDRLMLLNSMQLMPKKRLTEAMTGIKEMVKFFITQIVPQKKVIRKIIRNSKKYSYDNSKYVGVAFGFYGEKEILEREIFSDTVQIVFEDCLFNAPVYYDRYLRALYGNYMELPPPEKQISHHSFIPYWR